MSEASLISTGGSGGGWGGGSVSPTREKFFDFELFYVHFEAT